MEHARSTTPIRPAPQAIDRGGPLVRATFAHWLAKATRQSLDEVINERMRGDPAAVALIDRATSAPSTIAGNAGALVAEQAAAFVTSLAPASAAATLIQRGVTIPLDSRGDLTVPLHTAGAPAMAWTGEGEPIKVSSNAFDGLPIPARKIALIVTMSRELARRAAAASIFGQIMRESAAKSLDASYFGDAAGSDIAVAGLLNGVSAMTPQTGSGVEGMRADLAALAEAICGSGSSGEIVFLTSQARAARAAIIDPANRGLIIGSTAIPGDRVIACDPGSLLHGFGTAFDLETSSAASLHMEDASPAEIVSWTGPTTAAPVRSMFQTDTLATRAILDIGFVKRRVDCVAFIDGINAW